ncbi:SRPBCC domain-containing protein [Asanoa iriomotensis]|uniref:Activator of HSP90 ATPase n=1 Tax=Asanoa iriomotensis TaxID=234613 RepID=A0ABQ4CB21_9ACTN|nr:SRPBCC domain-containing protein [Asanoa iriomotensis]GIF59970.1 activator of HSP90 ATPase [Asanoa iriomotensis]
MDFLDAIKAVTREVGQQNLPEGPARSVVLRRSFPAPADDVWDALTDPVRVGRWFLPITGDFRVGGLYQMEGNAGGRILRCERPTELVVTWIFGADIATTTGSELHLTLSPEPDGGTELLLRHVAVVDPQLWAQYGPGATGVGWDLSFLGLGLHLAGGGLEDAEGWEESPEARSFMVASAESWGAAQLSDGASPEEVTAAVANTIAFYAPED